MFKASIWGAPVANTRLRRPPVMADRDATAVAKLR